MDHKSLSQSVLGRIKEEHIQPKPHWHFMIKNALFWVMFALSVFVGARALGVVIFVVSDLRPELLSRPSGQFVPHLLFIIPLFWLVLFILTIVIAVFGLHHTKKGYKISISTIIALNLLATILLGSLFFALGDGEKFERTVSERVRFIPTPELRRAQVWNTPIEGRIAGQVQEDSLSETDRVATLVDLTGKSWEVDLKNLELPRRPISGGDSETIYRLRIIGTQTGENTFKAEQILPWARLPEMRPPGFKPPPGAPPNRRMPLPPLDGRMRPPPVIPY